MADHGVQQTPRVKIIVILATLGLLSAAFGFGAEATKPELGEVNRVVQDEFCTYPSTITPMGLGAAALLALLVSRVYCPETRSPLSSSVVQLSRYLSWVSWLCAICFYVAGIIMVNNRGAVRHEVYTQGEYPYSYESYNVCQVVKPGIFGAGASFALASIILEIIYLVVTFDRVDKTTTHTSNQLCQVA